MIPPTTLEDLGYISRARRCFIWLAGAIATITNNIDRLGLRLARWFFWLGATEERKAYEARHAKFQEDVAKAIVGALADDAARTETELEKLSAEWAKKNGGLLS